MLPPFVLSIGAKLLGLDFKKLLPAIPFVAAFALGWFGNGWRLDSNRIEAELSAKDKQIEIAHQRVVLAEKLASDKEEVIAEWKVIKQDSDARVKSLEQSNLELSLRQPKDTTRIIEKTKDLADEIIDKNSEYVWLTWAYPDIMLNNANSRITASKNYGLPLPALAGDSPDRRGIKNPPAIRGRYPARN